MKDFELLKFLTKPDTSSMGAYAIALLMSLFFAGVLYYIYEIYQKDKLTGTEIHKSFPIIAPAVTLIFLVVQFSLPLSLGLLGALSIVRFRTPVKSPVEIGFILVVIATSLACAVYRYEGALLLVGVLAALTTLKNRLPFGQRNRTKRQSYELFLETKTETFGWKDIQSRLTNRGWHFKILSLSKRDSSVQYHLEIWKKHSSPEVIAAMMEALGDLPLVNRTQLLSHA